jgi:hypothetical protein
MRPFLLACMAILLLDVATDLLLDRFVQEGVDVAFRATSVRN